MVPFLLYPVASGTPPKFREGCTLAAVNRNSGIPVQGIQAIIDMRDAMHPAPWKPKEKASQHHP
jgi:hypothetical protein